MDKITDILHEAKRLRLLAAALELQHYTSTAANVVQIPGGDRVIVIGTPAEVRELLEIAPMAEASISALDAVDSVTGAVVANIAAFETERFYLADDVDGLIARCRQQAQQTDCQHKSGTTPHWVHVSCNECGSVKTDGSWGIASNKWFKSEAEAKFYKENGRYPDGVRG